MSHMNELLELAEYLYRAWFAHAALAGTPEWERTTPKARDEWCLIAESAKSIATRTPIPMHLFCPECGERHIDEGAFATKPHHTHACQHCGLCWRPALVPTVGVRFLPGFKNETPVAVPVIPPPPAPKGHAYDQHHSMGLEALPKPLCGKPVAGHPCIRWLDHSGNCALSSYDLPCPTCLAEIHQDCKSTPTRTMGDGDAHFHEDRR